MSPLVSREKALVLTEVGKNRLPATAVAALPPPWVVFAPTKCDDQEIDASIVWPGECRPLLLLLLMVTKVV